MFKDIDIKFVDKEITPFGGLSLFLKMVEWCGFEEELRECGLPKQGSNRGYRPWQLIMGLFAGVWCGASKFGHLDLVRYDRVLSNNYTLDFDTTLMLREGEQEGAAKGYIPKRPGRLFHHPILAFVSDIRMIATYWLQPGNTSASTNNLAFLEDTLEKLQGKTIGLIRMDSGFFAKEIMDYLESRELQYIVACKFTWPTKQELVRGRVWTEIDDGIEMTETTYQAQSWECPRRIVMVRQEVEKRPKADGKQVKQLCLFEEQSEYGKYRYSCIETKLALPMTVVYDTCRGRADSENRLEEQKADFAVDSFVMHNFWASEACGSFIVLAHNFFSLLRHALVNSPKKSFLKTICYEFIATPAYFSKSKDKHILYLARSLKTRSAFQGIWNSLDRFTLPYRVY